MNSPSFLFLNLVNHRSEIILSLGRIHVSQPGARRCRMKRNLWFAFGVFLLSAPGLVYGAQWQVDPDHSSFQFKVRHLTVSSVRGDFGKVIQGVVYFDPQDVGSTKAQLVLDAASVSTNHAKRDEHLRGPDFFDVSKYPTITYVSKQVMMAGPDALK